MAARLTRAAPWAKAEGFAAGLVRVEARPVPAGRTEAAFPTFCSIQLRRQASRPLMLSRCALACECPPVENQIADDYLIGMH